MQPFWVETDNPLRLAIVPRPRGGDWLENEIRLLKNAGADVLVSMLEPLEANELGLASEAICCKNAGIVFRSFPIPDRETPQAAGPFTRLIAELGTELHAGHSVAVHRRASIGRSSLLLASILCAEGFSVSDAFNRLSKARGLRVPDTHEQILWVERFAETQLQTPKQAGSC